MGTRIDLIGQQFGRLKVLRFVGVDKQKRAQWVCKCECGNEIIVRGNCLRREHTQSCGCFGIEQRRKNHFIKHGHSVGKPSPTYVSWKNMIERCTNANHVSFSRYGGRAVEVCNRWLKFEKFLEDMKERPAGKTLGRFADSGNYEPGNCSWQNPKEQWIERRKKNELKKAA